MFASLPMYDRPSNAAAHDELWGLIRDNLRDVGIDAPDHLTRNVGFMEGYARNDLALGQICNLPYRAKFRAKVTRIGTADYGFEGCAAGEYASVFIVHKDSAGGSPQDFSMGSFAANGFNSHSGYGAPQIWAMTQGFQFPAPTITGSHDESLRRVATGRAAIAAIDAQTWRHQQDDMFEAQNVRVIGQSQSSPSMSFITAGNVNPVPYFNAIQTAINNLTADAQTTLGLKGIIALPDAAFDLPMPPMPQQIDA